MRRGKFRQWREAQTMKLKKVVAVCLTSCLLSLSVFAASYTVKSGDTAWKIAQKYNVTVSDLKKANPGIKDITKIYVGQKLTIPSAQNTLTSYENQVVTLVNQQRALKGLGALKTTSNLTYVAGLKAQDMATKGYFSHTSPTYGSPFNMMEHFGIRFSAAGENIAYGQSTPQAVMNAWMNSPGHRANILNPSYTYIGVGAAKNSRGVIYWSQEFIKPM